MPLNYIEKEKLFQKEWEKRKKEALKNINKKIPDEYLLKIFETIILDNDTKVNEENPQQSQEFKTLEEKPLETNYIIRNPNPDENQLIEEKISAIDLFSLLFNPFLCFGEILINTTVVSKFFIPYIIIEHLKVGSINIQDLLKNLNQFTDEDLETLLSSEDTLCSSEAEQILLSLLNKE
ncbi:hypothetical protein [Spiroplasma endosymbiont of Colias croceus]|uniref:hypothetical protein n=1 Tax=Spiroplasma endosymbiont of Colias croceus TaxID=3066310 RepID=UPI0030D07877